MGNLLNEIIFPIIHIYFMHRIIKKEYNIHIEKSKVDFDCPRSEREARINECCGEYVERLEKMCLMYPYQWYNFFNFWG